MSISRYGLMALLLTIMATVSGFSSYAGYTVQGEPQGGLVASAPGILGVITWVWDSMKFMFQMVTFQVDNMPMVVSVIFGVMSFMVVFLIVSTIRGTE